MRASILLLTLVTGLIAACGDDHSNGQQAPSALTESSPMMAPGNMMMTGSPMMQMTPRMAR
jgi:hypothetical protein